MAQSDSGACQPGTEQKPFHRFMIRQKALALLVLSLLPPLFVVFLIIRNGQNIPFYDEWFISAPIAIDTASGELEFSDLWEPHNGHRLFFTHLLTAFLTVTADWDLRIMMAASFVLACLIYLLLLLLHRQFPLIDSPLILIVFSLLVFAPRQSDNWTWGLQTHWFFMIFFFMLALWILQYRGWIPLAAAAILCSWATYASAAGMFAWICLGGVLYFSGYRTRLYGLFWIVAAVLCLTLFFVGYTPSRNQANPDILTDVFFFWGYVGNIFIPGNTGPDVAILAGFVISLLFPWNLYYLRTKLEVEWRVLAPWLSIGGMGFFAAVSTSIFRSTAFGVDGAVSSRYTTTAVMMLIPFFLFNLRIIAHFVGQKKKYYPPIFHVNFIAIFLLGALYVYSNFLKPPEPLVNAEFRTCIAHSADNPDPECFAIMHESFEPTESDTLFLQQQLESLIEYKLAIFADE